MHYLVNEYIVFSELAAKPICQSNSHVLKVIEALPQDINVLDYGCGKLRYSIPLASRVKNVVAIDSRFQIEKKQIINGVKTTAKEYGAIQYSNLSVHCIEEESWKNEKYDIVFCTNVLSAIPDDETRLEVIKNAKNVICEQGFLYISVQYRNSYFSQYANRDDSIKYNDGWLLPRYNGKYSFYGLITINKMNELCNEAGMRIFEVICHEGSLYIKAKSCLEKK